MHHRPRTALLLLLLLAPLSPRAATNSDWFARPWQSEDGLPNLSIFGIAQTSDGYLWLGTASGLVRFDGLRFEEFSSTNFIAPPNNGIVTMVASRDGALWLAMDRGAIVRLEPNSSHALNAGFSNLIPNGLAEDAEGTLWAAYRGGALFRVSRDTVTRLSSQEGLPEGTDICALAADSKGRVWFAKAGQFGLIHNGSLEPIRSFEPLPARLAHSKSGGLWLCVGFHLFKVDETGKTEDFGEFHPGRSGTLAAVILEDREGAVWVGTTYSGLFRRDSSGFQTIPTTHQEILSLAEDREGNIWAGTAGGGLDRIRRRSIVLEGPENGLPFPAVQSLCEDHTGTLWAVTANGQVARRSNSRWTPVPTNWPSDATCITAGNDNEVYVGTRLHGVQRWKGGELTVPCAPGAIRGQTIHTLVASANGDLWLGEETPHCIQRLRGGEMKTFELAQEVRIIRAMAEDPAGNIWAGSSKGTLFRITGDVITELTPRPEELASIRCLTATPDGALWIGFAGWGLGRLKDGHFTEIRTEQGLYDNYISHIVADERGWLWFAANRGLFKVRQDNLEAFAMGQVKRVRSIHYGRGEGLPGLQGNFGDSPDCLRASDGRLFIPMRTALAVVEPERARENPEPPPTLLTRVVVDDHSLAEYRGIFSALKAPGLLELGSADARLTLPPGHRRLEFEFAALSFTAPENVQFRYRLDNYDQDWIEAGTRRFAPYSRLGAGDYLFRVIACSADGVWAKTGAVLSLTVKPFFWQTWSFRSTAVAAFTLILIAVVRYVFFRRLHQRLAALEQQAALHKERARIAKDIHDDLGANLTQIALLGELAQQDRGEPDKASERVNIISTTARQAIKSLDEIVWAVNPRNDTLAHLIDYAGQFAVDYLRLAGIRCRLDFPERAPERQLSTDLRHNLFLVIKEALNNIVKHSRASEAWLRAKVTADSLDFVVEDNGCGFERAPENATSDGLRNMRQRMADIGGEFHIESQPGKGTKVSLHLPWSAKQ